MGKVIEQATVTVSKDEYNLLKEVYKSVKRQDFLLRIAQAEENLKRGSVKKISIEKFIS